MRCAQQWIDIVEARTGHEVAIYTNQSWWDSVIGNAGKPLAKDQPIWISRYPGGGPAHLPSWTAKGGSPKWKMPPLPIGAGYPATTYTVGHFWQFGEEAG